MKESTLGGQGVIPDLEQAAKFLVSLTGSTTATFQVFSDDKLENHKGIATWRHGSLARLGGWLTSQNRQGAGVFVMVNEGDGRGRSAKNVTKVRAIFLDTDGAPLPKDLALTPHIVVESSPGKWHVYWLVSDLPLAEFSVCQRHLAQLYGCDRSVCDPPRVMRLPGFCHCKSAPRMVKITQINRHAPYARTQILAAWPELLQELERRQAVGSHHAVSKLPNPRIFAGNLYAQAALERECAAVASAVAGTRHETLKLSACRLMTLVHGGQLERAEVCGALLNAALAAGLSEAEVSSLMEWSYAAMRDKLRVAPCGPSHLNADPAQFHLNNLSRKLRQYNA